MQDATAEGEGETLLTGTARVERLAWAMRGSDAPGLVLKSAWRGAFQRKHHASSGR